MTPWFTNPPTNALLGHGRRRALDAKKPSNRSAINDGTDPTSFQRRSIDLLHVVPRVGNEASGPSYSVVRLCEGLLELGQGATLVVLAESKDPDLPDFVKTFHSGPGPQKLGISPQMYRWMLGKAKRRSLDLIHNHSLWMMPNVYPGWVAKKTGVPYVVSPRGTLSRWAFAHGSPLKRLFWPIMQRPALEAVTCWHATSQEELSDIRRMGFKQPVAVIPNAIDISPVRSEKNRDKKTLLFLGRIHPIKGLDMLLRAWKILQRRFPLWRLRIVGPDNNGYLYRCQSLARDLKLQRVEFVGPLFAEAKWKAYAESDLFVLPTYSENFAMTVAEALACGTPAVVSKGAPWEGLEANRCGRWIDIGRDSLITALEDTMSLDAEDLQEMGERGRRWMMRDYCWQRVSEEMVETYRWILGCRERPEWVAQD